MLRIRDYLLSLTVIFTAYWLYAQTAVRWIEPAITAKRAVPKTVHREETKLRHPYAHLFPAGSWELENPKILETNQGTLLFQSYAPREQGRLEIRPCTLIAYAAEETDSPSQSARPIVLQANQGALLQFEGDVDLTRGKFGRLLGGRIQGEIRVFCPESMPGAADQLEMQTRNVQIDSQRVWTPHEVTFRYGQHFGSGHDLLMALTPSEKINSKKVTGPQFGGVQSIQLAQVKEMQIQAGGSSFFPHQPSTTGEKSASADAIRITCEGPFKFNVAGRVATFEDQVLVQRITKATNTDQLRCKQLAIFLVGEPESNAPVTDLNDKTATQKQQKAAIERIVAVGTPVILDAPSQSAYSEAERLEYNAVTQQILLKMLSTGTRVKVRRGGDEFIAPELAYEMSATQGIGKLWAPGPGSMTSVIESKGEKRTFTASWRREIRMRPHEANFVISLMDDARVEMPGYGNFRGNEFHLWMLERSQPSQALPGTTQSSLGSLVPDRLLALGRVEIDSPQLLANVERVEAWFEQIPTERPQVVDTQPATPAPLVLNTPDGASPVPQVITPIREPERQAMTAEQTTRYRMQGELVRMQLRLVNNTASVENFSVQGKEVKIREISNGANEEQPFYLSGNKIDVSGGLGYDSQISVTGEPALVAAQDMTLRSAGFTLNRRDGRFLVEQAGEMSLPVKQGLSGEKLEESQRLNLAWQGSLLFDGLNIKVREGVQIRGQAYNVSANELQAKLTQPFSFKNTSQVSADIKSIHLKGNVDLENRTFTPEGRQQSLEKLLASELTVNQQSGEFNAIGPGWLSVHNVGATPVFGEQPTGQSFVSAQAKESGITFLRVDFRTGMSGNLSKRFVDFEDQVQALFGPVSHWNEEITAQSPESLGDRGALLSADKLSVAEISIPGQKQNSLDLAAVGNTRVEGRDFHAFAARLTYATGKNQLVLEGDGRLDAKIRRRADNTYIEAQRILFQRDTNAVQVDGSRVLTFGPLGNTPNAPRPPSPRDIRSRQ